MKAVKIFTLASAFLLMTSCTDINKPRIMQNSPMPDEITACEILSDSIPNKSEVEEEYEPLNFDIQKSVWISYIELSELISETESGFKENMSEVFSNVSELGCNTVYVHVRAFGDAYYASSLFPPASCIPTDNGRIKYDPLKIMTETAHEYGLSFHAWINPMRCDSESNMQHFEGSEIYEWYSDTSKYSEYISKPEDSELYWLNPSKSEVRQLIAEGAKEIVLNYDVDGIHMDDYFYPTTDESFDKNAYIATGGNISLAQWRLDNCSQMVSEIYSSVKSANSKVLFGISPQGNVDNNYSQVYADVDRWCSESGYVDYIVPQIYFGYDNDICPFSETLESWESIVKNDEVSLICGIGVYKLDSEAEFIDNPGLIAKQVSDVLSDEQCSGFALYSYNSLFLNNEERFEAEREMIFNLLNDP
ncbi:MAG: glycoside hydrolase family 10 protein [Oscillospiraceae bacterium]